MTTKNRLSFDEARKLPVMGYWNVRPPGRGPDEDAYASPLNKERIRAQREALLKANRAEVAAKVRPMPSAAKLAVLAYMDAADPEDAVAYMGWAECRVCPSRVVLGTMDMVTPDWKWRFPEGWQHYVLVHGCAPDDAFVKDALAWHTP